MAQKQTQKARKEYTCNKCNQKIEIGDKYFKIVEQFRSTRFRCKNCEPKRWELTSSEYLSWLWKLQEDLAQNYDTETEEGKDGIYNEIDDMKNQLQEKLDSIPYQLQEGNAGTILQERIDTLEDAISELDDLEFPEREDFEPEEDEIDDDLEGPENRYQEAVMDYSDSITSIVQNLS